MKINLIGMILNNCGRRSFEGAVISDGKQLSAADSLHYMILEYAKVVHGGESSVVTTSREVTPPIITESNGDWRAKPGQPLPVRSVTPNAEVRDCAHHETLKEQ